MSVKFCKKSLVSHFCSLDATEMFWSFNCDWFVTIHLASFLKTKFAEESEVLFCQPCISFPHWVNV